MARFECHFWTTETRFWRRSKQSWSKVLQRSLHRYRNREARKHLTRLLIWLNRKLTQACRSMKKEKLSSDLPQSDKWTKRSSPRSIFNLQSQKTLRTLSCDKKHHPTRKPIKSKNKSCFSGTMKTHTLDASSSLRPRQSRTAFFQFSHPRTRHNRNP